MKLLVVDDSRLARKKLVRTLTRILADTDYSIVEGDSGKKALELVHSEKPDVMFLDLTMPIMSGYEVLESLKKMGWKAPVAVVSADVQEKGVEKVMALGARIHIQKPITEQALRNFLSSLSS